MIFDHFRATGAHDAGQGLSHLLIIRLQNDDVQDFDVRWDQALLTASQIPAENVLKGFCKLKIRDSVQLQTVLASYDEEIVRNQEVPSYSRSKTMVRRHIDQMIRTRNFKARDDRIQTGAVTESQQGRKVSVERKVGECHQWKATGQCSNGDYCSCSHGEAPGNGCGHGQKGQSSSPTSLARTQTDAKNIGKIWSQRESPSGMKGQRACKQILRGKRTNPSCDVCQNYKSVSGCKNGDYCQLRHTEVDGQPNNKSKECDGEGSVALLKESVQLGCVSQDYHPREVYSTGIWKIGIESHRPILHGHVAPNENSGKKGFIARNYSKVCAS